MAIDPPRIPPRGTGSLVPGAIRPPVVIPPPPGKPVMPAPVAPPPRAPGTTKLDPDVLKTHLPAFQPLAPDLPDLKAPPAMRAVDKPAWVGVKRQLKQLDGLKPAQLAGLEKRVAAYAREGGDPKVARAILKQIEAPLGAIGQANAHTCAVTGPQLELARRSPGRYFRIMKALADDGVAMMEPGKVLQTGKENYVQIMKQDLPMNDRLNLLFQTAGMEYANLSAKYDVTADASSGAVGEAKSYQGVGETGAEEFGQALLEGKSDLIGHNALRKRVRALERDHREAGMTVPPPGELRVRALRQLIEEGQARGRESFFIKLKVPGGGRHHFVLDKVDPTGVTLVDQRGPRRMTDAQLAEYLTLAPGRGGYDPAIAMTGATTAGRRR